ncbi:MAG: lipid A deacylase LpxR family protein [Opitutaceae bacterium]|nr:lipid A deacylase LpxR family protein [Opitutaceae bacterium]
MKTRMPVVMVMAIMVSASGGRADVDRKVPVERARNAPVLTLYFENDYFGGEDRHYTNGVKLSWISGDLTDWGQEGWRKNVIEGLPFVNRPDTQKNIGLAIGQNIYTPQATNLVVPDPADRPYAGWSYLELSFISKTERVMDKLAVQAGIVGPQSYAEDSQRIVHEWINDDAPRGWDSQLKNELGINLIVERKWRLYGRSFSETLGFDFIPHAGASLGNVQTYANAGGLVRLGFNLPSDFGVDLIRGGGAVSAPVDDEDPRVSEKRNWSFFVFGGVDGRAVARDIFLDGNTFRDSASVDKKNFVGDAYYGFGVIIGTWQLTYTEAMRTLEFDGQDGKSYFGSVTLSKAF